MSPRSVLAVLGLLVIAACGTTEPPPPPPPGPVLVCPSSPSVDSAENLPVPVSFTVPVATGGQTPVAVTCSAQSGSLFPLGSTIVTCTASDALQRQASCNFNVSVKATPRISKTRFLAFGDSLTEGYKVDPYNPPPARMGFGLFGLGPSHSYPFKLNTLLTDRYRAQTIVMDNEGIGGELASADLTLKYTSDGRPVGELRLPSVLNVYSPQVLLLMEGTNDLFFSVGETLDNGIPGIIDVIDGMVSEALSRQIHVFLATLPPQRLGSPRDRVAQVIPQFNDEIRALAQRKGPNVTLVDVYAAVNQNINLYVGDDHLHLTEQGFQVVADTFFAAIRDKLDVTPTSAFAR